jgi:L-ascorbate metabolism protein UlaG (beta-lactamase superfamily)
MIESTGGNIYFAGDTGYGRFVKDIAGRFRHIRLAILPIGSYEKRWFMKPEHMNPDDAVRVQIEIRAAQAMGMHYATFAEHPEQAIDAHERDLDNALAEHDLEPEDFWVLGFGEGRDVPPLVR